MTDAFAQLRPERLKRSARAEMLLRRVKLAGEMPAVRDRPYLIKGWLDRRAVSVVYGAPNSGKSFWAIDVAHHVHMGVPWAGHRVKQGAVLYCAAEGGALFANRLAARKARFAVLPGPLTLAATRNNDAIALAEAVEALSEVHGPFHLIVVDTMARAMAGADENAAADIAGLLHGLTQIVERTGAHLMLVHHCGKDAARGARGHSSLRAAVDTEIEIAVESGQRVARTTKQRDMAGGSEMPFRLAQRTLFDRDADGDPVTSCVVEHEGGQPTQKPLI